MHWIKKKTMKKLGQINHWQNLKHDKKHVWIH